MKWYWRPSMSKIVNQVKSTKQFLMINGERVETSKYAPLYSPYSGEEIAQVAMADKGLTKQAIDAAYNARGVIAKMPAYKRAEILENVVALLKEKSAEAAEIIEEARLPAGVLNVVTGPGGTVGEAIVEDNRISMVTFTGSPSVGIGIRNKAELKKTTLELGSNSALIIDKEIDIDQIIDRCIMGAFSNQGQVCISLQRVYVHEDVYEEFVTKFKENAKKLKIGDPLDPGTYISALISKGETERVLNWIEETKDSKATIQAGGKLQDGILEPTIITDAGRSLKVSCQEAFAPVVIVNKVSSVKEAIKQVNDSRFGLQAGIYTNNVKNALYASRELHVGGVIINDVPTYRVDQMPYGGVKESGTGREGIKYAVEEMTEMKLVVWNQS